MKYKVIVKETLKREVEVEAEDEADAIYQVEDMYRHEDIVLGAEDFAYTNIKLAEDKNE